MKKATKSLIKSYTVVSGFVFLVGFLFPPMIFQSNPVDHLMKAIYSGLFTLVVSWLFLISGAVIHRQYTINNNKEGEKQWKEK